MRVNRLVIASLLILVALPALAAVKTEEKSQVQFSGAIGRMMNLFGGKAMREGLTETAAVKGNRKRTVMGDTGQIIDLDEEKIYDLDMKDRSYRVMTFEEMRQRMQKAMEDARKQAPPATSQQPQAEGKEMQIDFDLKESGQRKTINGYDCREVVMTVSVYEKGKKIEESGGMVMTGHMWLTPRIAAMKEMEEFDLRYAQKMASIYGSAVNAEQMAAAMAMYPYMKDAMAKFQAESVNMDGTTVLTSTTMEAVASREQAAQQQAQQQPPERESSSSRIPSMGGILGGLGRRAARRGSDDKQEAPSGAPASGSSPGRATIMTMNNELVKVSPDVTDADLAIPAGFKLKK
ncbi:MAG: hypothetical protein A3H28_14455 [Acidobacteria bacterium RIFCSPLOWO2_02_FULL_61_28]|nr:MAG: hypothetical protein A3H28_14455 [Acidobacteria bacterium RIFCSPLOWO2_02_FULL_61_28]